MLTRAALRALASCAAIAIVGAASLGPCCRTADGGLSGRFVLGLALGGAVALAGWTARTRWMRSGLWLALALAGQGAALQLIDAGVLVHYQHYKLPPEALADPALRWTLVIVVAQGLAVAGGLAGRGGAIVQWMRRPRRAVQVALVLAACGCVAAPVSRDPWFFLAEVPLALLIQLVNAGNILLAAWTLPAEALPSLARRFDSWLGDREPEGASVDRFVLLAAVWVTAISAALAWSVYERHPHLADEVAYLYNARYFAAGTLTMAPPPLVEAFDLELMDYRPDKWFSTAPPGWPAVLAVGAAVHVPWLVNPILAGVNILLIYLLLGEIYPRRTARLSVLLLCVSPWNVFLAMSYMTHTITMTFAVAALLGVAKARRTGLTRWAWLAGFAVGAGSVVRPLDGLIVAALAGGWALGSGGARQKVRVVAALVAGTALTGALVLPYNKALTGDATRTPMNEYRDKHYGPKSNAYGFGPERGLGWPLDAYPGHTPFEALINAELNGASVNTDLFGWSTGSLILIAGLLVSRGMRRSDYLMLAAAAAVIIAYAPYWYSGGPDFGARYWYLILVPCVALSARGLERIETVLGFEGRHDARAAAAVAALSLLALATYFPWRSLDKYHHYLEMRPGVRELAREHGFGRSLVLVRGARFPDYASAAIYNPLDLNANVPVYVWDRNAEVRAKVVSLYADRPVWIVEGPTRARAGFRLVAGPLNAAQAASGP